MHRDRRFPSPLSSTRQAAQACLERLAQEDVEDACRDASPRGAFRVIARVLRQEGGTRDKVWVVDADADAEGGSDRHGASAWPFWLHTASGPLERPLLYLLRSVSVAGLRSAMLEATGRGIFFNAAETTDSRWPKGVQPAVPLWLSGSPDGVPYDPASGPETLAIVRSALQALYVEGQPGFVYLSLHDARQNVPAPLGTSLQHACTGMYRLRAAASSGHPRIRLLGAGKALGEVVRAADLLGRNWGIDSEIWSCPSYTGLARDGHAAEHWSMFHPMSSKRVPQVEACLGPARAPVLAVTGYGQHVASQIGGFVPAPFVSIGDDPHPGAAGPPTAERIATVALRALADEGSAPARWAGEALQRYAAVR